MWARAIVFSIGFSVLLPGAMASLDAALRESEVARLQFREVGVDEAFRTLSAMSRDATDDEGGVNIVYMGPEGEAAPKVTLSLRRVSLYDAIRFITDATGLHFRIDDNAVIISDQPFRSERIITRFYPVQPTFMDVIRGGREKEEPQPRRDPFGW